MRPKYDNKDKPTKPETFGKLAIDTYRMGGSSSMTVPILTLLLLDQLCDDLNSSKKDSQKLSTLYETYVESDDDGNMVGYVTLR